MAEALICLNDLLLSNFIHTKSKEKQQKKKQKTTKPKKKKKKKKKIAEESKLHASPMTWTGLTKNGGQDDFLTSVL